MNSQIETWRVQQYTANVYHLAQQKGSRLASKVRNEKYKGKAEFFDRLGLASAVKKSGRNTDTPDLDIAHSRRMVVSSLYEWATLVDRKDKLQNIHDPENQYSISAQYALGRAMDDVIIAAAGGAALGGEDGSSSTSQSNTQKLASVSGGNLDNLNVSALRRAKQIFDQGEVQGKRYFVYSALQMQRLLSQTEVTSADYNTVRALVQGEIGTFLGFEFIHSERLLTAATNSSAFIFDTTTGLFNSGGTAMGGTEQCCFAFVDDGIILGMNEGAIGRVDERKDKSYSMQVYASMDFGAVRMEEAKVVEVICKAT